MRQAASVRYYTVVADYHVVARNTVADRFMSLVTQARF